MPRKKANSSAIAAAGAQRDPVRAEVEGERELSPCETIERDLRRSHDELIDGFARGPAGRQREPLERARCRFHEGITALVEALCAAGFQ